MLLSFPSCYGVALARMEYRAHVCTHLCAWVLSSVLFTSMPPELNSACSATGAPAHLLNEHAQGLLRRPRCPFRRETTTATKPALQRGSCPSSQGHIPQQGSSTFQGKLISRKTRPGRCTLQIQKAQVAFPFWIHLWGKHSKFPITMLASGIAKSRAHGLATWRPRAKLGRRS